MSLFTTGLTGLFFRVFIQAPFVLLCALASLTQFKTLLVLLNQFVTMDKAPANKVEAYFIQYGKPALTQLNLFVKNTLGDASKLQITFSHVLAAGLLLAVLSLASSFSAASSHSHAHAHAHSHDDEPQAQPQAAAKRK